MHSKFKIISNFRLIQEEVLFNLNVLTMLELSQMLQKLLQLVESLLDFQSETIQTERTSLESL